MNAEDWDKGTALAAARPAVRRLSDHVANEIEERILRQTLRPEGTLPTEGELGELLGVSRSVIRDAMRTLAARGLVEIQQGRGSRVTEPSDEAFTRALLYLLLRTDLLVGDILDARAAIETGVLPIAATNRTKDDLSVLERTLTGFIGALDEKDWERVKSEHLAFHIALLEATHIPALTILLKPIEEVIVLSATPPATTEVAELWETEAHQAIFDAIAAGDVDATRQAVRDHYAYMERDVYRSFRTMLFRDLTLTPGRPQEPSSARAATTKRSSRTRS